MATVPDPTRENPVFLCVAASFAALVAAAWWPLPGMAIALAWFGAALVSGHLVRLWRWSRSPRQRGIAVLGLALSWFAVLAYAALTLPSNFSSVLI